MFGQETDPLIIYLQMKPKTLNLLYWTFTILFSLLMIFSASGGLKPSEDSVKMIHDGLGYPVYFIQFLSFAKLIGAIVILIPGLKITKEWAYAGLFFDLGGAIFSAIAAYGKVDPMMLFMLLWIVPGILSYYYWHKRMRNSVTWVAAADTSINSKKQLS
jgi:hypothetical protein